MKIMEEFCCSAVSWQKIDLVYWMLLNMAAKSTISVAAHGDAVAHQDYCICTACVCGSHMCPPTPHYPHYSPNLQSISQAVYTGKGKPVERVGAPNQQNKINHNAMPFNATTTFRDDYKQFNINKRPLVRTSASLNDTGVAANNVTFTGKSTSRVDYIKFNGVSRGKATYNNNQTIIKPNASAAQGYWQTTNRADYNKKPLERPVPAQNLNLSRDTYTSIPFTARSSAEEDFPAYSSASRAKPVYHMHRYDYIPDNRDFLSEHRSNYKPKVFISCPSAPLAVATKFQSGHIKLKKVGPNTYQYQNKE
jgi:hypothetical protein